jgi:DNA repair exonuclease SbcCD ATPase subunit
MLLACLTTALLFAGCKQEKKKAPDLIRVEQNDSVNKLIAQKDNEINDMMGTLNQIDDGFQQINEAENRVNLEKSGEGADKSQQLKENIQFIANRMRQNRALISKLQNLLAQSSFKNEQLRATMNKTIRNLMKQLNEKDQQLQELRVELDAKDIHISELDETINNLNTNVNDLQTQNTQNGETISAQDKQLNTAWFVFGTKNELKEQHIIEGGKVLQANFNKNYFTKIDIRSNREIKLYSKSARILTVHPSGSYSLSKDTNKQYVLKITNPQIFWSTSKYLVILVK